MSEASRKPTNLAPLCPDCGHSVGAHQRRERGVCTASTDDDPRFCGCRGWGIDDEFSRADKAAAKERSS